MNYEKAYKEALGMAEEIIRYYKEHNRNHEASIEDLESVFPELADSEDERIRNALIRFHKSTIDVDGIKGDDIIVWLEKQGQTFTKKDVDDAYLKGICDAKHELEKQGEQKPILDFKASNFYVSKVDGKIHDMTYNPADKVEPKFKVKYAGSEYNVLEVKDIAGVTFYGIEDEPNHIDYIKADNCEIISGYAIKENGSPYPTKPAAWSEEDSKRIDYICDFIWKNRKVDADEIYQQEQDVKWLKSLKKRIIWKPSKKQMETLEYYMHTLLATEHKEVLFGLYNDLKKL